MKVSPVQFIAGSVVVASLVAGSVAGQVRAAHPAAASSKTCVAAKTDLKGGPYPAKVSADCTSLKAVTVWVAIDSSIGGGFSPSNITIKKGTTVTWIWKSGSHNLSPWETNIQNPGFKFSFKFAKAGTFKYMCQVHPGQNGQIIVK